MPSGVMRLRHSKSAPKSMPRVFHSLTDVSGLRGTGTRHVETNVDVGSGLAPTKSRPFKTTGGAYPFTGVPISAEEPVRGEAKTFPHRKLSK